MLHLDVFPQEGEGDFLERLNPKSLEVLRDAKLEPAVAKAEPSFRCQLFRHGYFCVDRDSQPERLEFNLTIGLRDSWAKLEKKLQG
jgi:glutaminyl-tRNA synthetase